MKISIVFLWLLLSALPSEAGTVHVSAAASLTDALREIAGAYGAAHPESEVRLNFSASGALARQIAQGAPSDLYISANPRWMDYLVQKGRVRKETIRPLARNTLVFIGEPDSPAAAMEELHRLSRIALGSPASVPAGQYAEAAMENAGIYSALESEGKLVLAKDARQALVYADRGEVGGAFVYRTDASLARHAVVLFEVPEELYPPVLYPASLTVEGRSNPEAAGFYAYLFSPEAKEVLKGFGFETDF